MMAFALYAEHKLFMDPCPLCVFQRIAVIGIGLAFLLLAIHNPQPGWAKRIYLGLLGLAGRRNCCCWTPRLAAKPAAGQGAVLRPGSRLHAGQFPVRGRPEDGVSPGPASALKLIGHCPGSVYAGVGARLRRRPGGVRLLEQLARIPRR